MHPAKHITLSVHGDDFMAAGPKSSLDWFEARMKQRCKLTVGESLGPTDGDCKEAFILNRIVRWTATGMEYEADPRQGGNLLQELSLDDRTKGCVIPDVQMPRIKLNMINR